MRLGISGIPRHNSPGEWAGKLADLGCRAVVFPCDSQASDAVIDAYAQACRDYDLLIAEVGAWVNAIHPDPAERRRNQEYCRNQLSLAEYTGARCCVNIAGSTGEVWDGGYVENYSAATRGLIVDTVREIIDGVRPSRTFYTLEPMPWMIPDSPESYAALIGEIDRSAFAVHLDVVNMIRDPERYFFNSAFIERCFALLGPEIKSCHVKDVRLEPFLTLNLKETACGQGNLDIVAYARLADKTDPDMPFIIEHLHSEEEYAASIAYVGTLLKEHGIPSLN